MSETGTGPDPPASGPGSEALRVTAEVAKVLDRLGVTYCVGGSLASSLHGVPRSTQDADLAAALEPGHVEPLAAALQKSFYVASERIEDAVRRRSSFNVIHLETLFKVDVFCVGDEPHARLELQRRQRFTVAADRVLEVASAEDTVLHKLIWYRKGGEVSDRQWGDLMGVLQVQGERLDLDYLRRWAEELKVLDLLERALREAEGSAE